MMTRNKSKRSALIKYVLALPIFLLLTAALASPKMPILAKAEVLGDKVVASIDGFEKAQLAVLKPETVLPIADSTPPIVETTLSIEEGGYFVYLGNFKNGGTITTAELEIESPQYKTEITRDSRHCLRWFCGRKRWFDYECCHKTWC